MNSPVGHANGLHAVLFVCSGNTCRSAIAAALFRAGAGGSWWIESAGLRAVRGAPASSGAVIALSSLGVDLSFHRSKPLEDVAVEQFPLVLVMTDEHRRDLLSRYPALRGRVYLLAEMAGTECDVEDPYGEGVQFYARTTEQIRGYLVAGLGRMLELGLMRGFP